MNKQDISTTDLHFEETDLYKKLLTIFCMDMTMMTYPHNKLLKTLYL